MPQGTWWNGLTGISGKVMVALVRQLGQRGAWSGALGPDHQVTAFPVMTPSGACSRRNHLVCAGLLDPTAFETCFVRLMQRVSESLRGVMAIDGKTLRGSFDEAAGKSPLHCIGCSM